MFMRLYTGAVKRSMEGVINNRGERPSGSMPRRCTTHGATITEEKGVSGVKKDFVHGVVCFSAELDSGRVRWANATVVQSPIMALNNV